MSRLSSKDDSLLGRPDTTVQCVPSWSGFCTKLQDQQENRQSSVAYLPVIPACPTEMSTVFALMQKIVAMAQQLNQPDIVAVFDQAISAKVLDIQWKHPELFKAIVPRMGAFHIACTFLAVIGRRFGNVGLRDILVENCREQRC